MEAFSELVDPAHFEQVYDSVGIAEKFLRDSYNKAEWRGLGSWNNTGCIPEHYIYDNWITKLLNKWTTVQYWN